MADTVDKIITSGMLKKAIIKYVNESTKLESWAGFRVTDTSVDIPERFTVEFCEGEMDFKMQETPCYIDELQMISISKEELYFILTRNFAPAPNLVANKIKRKDPNFPADAMIVGVGRAC